MTSAGLSLLTFNIGNPSAERAQRQLRWLIGRDEDVLVLTETKDSAGCRLLADAFTAAGYAVHYPQPGPGEYGTMIIATVPVTPDGFGDRVGYLPSRAAAVILPAPGGPLRVIGLYVPARDASIGKTERKRKWLAGSATAAGTTMPSALSRCAARSPTATISTSLATTGFPTTRHSRCTWPSPRRRRCRPPPPDADAGQQAAGSRSGRNFAKAAKNWLTRPNW